MKNKGKTVKCIVVDPVHKVVASAWLTWDEAKAWIGCELMEAVDLGGGTKLWVDEEGWLKGPPSPWFLKDTLFCGRAVFAGSYHGGWEEFRIPLDLIQGLVAWVPDRLTEQAVDITLGDRGFFPLTKEGMDEVRRSIKRRQAAMQRLRQEAERCVVQDIQRFEATLGK